MYNPTNMLSDQKTSLPTVLKARLCEGSRTLYILLCRIGIGTNIANNINQITECNFC